MAEMSARFPSDVNLPQDPVPFREVRVHAPAEVVYDLKKVQEILPKVLGRLGCPTCCSGFDIRFLVERDLVVDPRSLDVRGIDPIA